MEFEIVRPRLEDIDEIRKMLKSSLEDTFSRNGIDTIFEIDEEIDSKIEKLKADIINHDNRYYFLLAKSEGRIVGVSAFFPLSEIIREHIPGSSEEDLEIGCVYLDPDHQRLGIGSMLFGRIENELKRTNRKGFYLCSGFETSQAYWKSKLGEPLFAIRDIWGIGKHELIWKCEIAPSTMPT